MHKHGFGPGAFVYVADSAMVTKENLETVGPNRLVIRLPASYKQCECAIRDAVDAQAWEWIGTLAKIPTRGNRPCVQYKSFETSVTLYDKEYRAAVVHSSSHDKHRQKKYDRMVGSNLFQLLAVCDRNRENSY